jgi:hypothetical protein
MKVKMPAEDLSVLAIDDWIARLRDGPDSDDAADGAPVRDTRTPKPDAPGRPAVPAAAVPAAAVPAAAVPAAAVPAAAVPAAAAQDSARAGYQARAVIGDELRIPVAWCELAPCIVRYSDPAALGEADIRARALAAGWQFDGLGRLACPQCQQSSPWFWPAQPIALWDGKAAAIMVALMAARHHEGRAGDGPRAGEGPRAARPPVSPPRQAATTPRPGQAARGRHRKHP